MTFTEPKERARAFGVFGAIAGGGAAIGLVLGGILTEYFSWRWCLGVNVPIAVVVAVAAFPILTESKAHGDTSYDVPGAVLSTVGLVSLVYGFTGGQARRGLDRALDDRVPGGGGGPDRLPDGGEPGPEPVDANVAPAQPQPWRCLPDLPAGGRRVVRHVPVPDLLFPGRAGLQPAEVGFALPFSGGIILAAGVVAQLLPRVGPKPLTVVGLAMSVAGMLWLTQITPGNDYVSHVLPSMIIMSVGLAGVFIPAASLALVNVGDTTPASPAPS